MDDICPYREGVTLSRPTKEGKGSFVNVGTRKELMCDKHLTPGVRVTVRMDPHDHGKSCAPKAICCLHYICVRARACVRVVYVRA